MAPSKSTAAMPEPTPDPQSSNWGGHRERAGRISWQTRNERAYPAKQYTGGFVPGAAGLPSAFFGSRVASVTPIPGRSLSSNSSKNTEYGSTGPALTRDILSAEQFQLLEQELAEADGMRVHEGTGDARIEGCLCENSGDIEEDMRRAEQETQQADESITGAHQEYLEAVLEKIKNQIKLHSQPDCYRDGTFWIRPRDPVFALNASRKGEHGLSPVELYHLPVFVWFPDMLPDAPDSLVCSCGHKLIRNGYNHKPIARRVRYLDHDYFLLAVWFRCDENARRSPGCGKSFQSTDPHIIQQLPRHLQESFPAFLTARGATDKTLMALMCSTFANRFGPEPFASLLGEMRHLHHAHRELAYLATCASHPSSTPPPPPFSEFADPLRYAGKYPSNWYCKAIFVDWMRAHSIYFDHAMACLPGGILKGDHTFKVAKYISRLSGAQVFEGIYTLVNEWEEIQAQSLTLTKSLSVVQDMISGVADGLEAHGHPPTYQMYTDNARAELTFHETTTPALAKDVVHVDPDPYAHRRKLEIPSGYSFKYYEAPDLIDAACLRIIEVLPEDETQKCVIGLDILFEMDDDDMGDDERGSDTLAQRQAQIDVISISTSQEIYLFKLTKYASFSALPPCLRSILCSKQIIKVGYAIRAQFQRISEAWPHRDFDEIVDSTGHLDLYDIAHLKGKLSSQQPKSLDLLCGQILDRRIVKASKLRLSHWSMDQLSNEHMHPGACMTNSRSMLQLGYR
ncbi:hypothetical protein C8J56DRAFT_446650 [Mycena floridula]|nr:hypothetical protein C8J56DRAFT_446650 [Mycena floridula]